LDQEGSVRLFVFFLPIYTVSCFPFLRIDFLGFVGRERGGEDDVVHQLD